MAKGPDFSECTKQTLAKRAGQVCSNPDCRRPTSGPHSDQNKAINIGEAAHIRAARQGQARYDASMTDEDRSAISNGIWLCRECARKIDIDEVKYLYGILMDWKEQHEKWVAVGKPDTPGREIHVKNGGVGSIICNEGQGIGLDILHQGKGPAERIVVQGSGIGEIVISSGQGTGKRIISTGGGAASESHVVVNKPVQMAGGLCSKLVIKTCDLCGRPVQFAKVIQGFAGDSEPSVSVKCPQCGGINII